MEQHDLQFFDLLYPVQEYVRANEAAIAAEMTAQLYASVRASERARAKPLGLDPLLFKNADRWLYEDFDVEMIVTLPALLPFALTDERAEELRVALITLFDEQVAPEQCWRGWTDVTLYVCDRVVLGHFLRMRVRGWR